MPPKLCGRCSKTVYPTEELKCLDKVWHKGCFKCQSCNMTLNMKNYKGYDKLPYCNAHYPQTKHTVVADTPENRRIAENTKIQSNLQYHKAFEESKNKFTVVSDTPEMKRQLQNSENISMIKYHADFEKQKGKKITVADDPEVQRVRQNMNIISNVSYHGEKDRRQMMEMARPAEQVEGQQRGHQYNRRSSGSRDSYGGDEGEEAGQVRTNPGRIVDYDPATEQRFQQGQGGTPYSNRSSAGAKQVYDSNIGKEEEETFDAMSARDAARRVSRGSVKNRVQRFSSSGDDDSGQISPRSPSGYQRSSRTSREYDGVIASLEQPASRKVGSISDYDPVNEKYGSVAGQFNASSKRVQPPQQVQQPPPPQQPAYQPPPQQFQPPPPEPQQPQDKYAGKGMCCQAMYDYDAADADEVSFKEGDMVVYCQPIDAGWMEGTVERTGQRGMLPSNYVEKTN